MKDLTKRQLLFFGVCIPIRLAMVYAYQMEKLPRRWMIVAAVVCAIGLAYLYLADKRKTAFETGGAPIWWNDSRPVYAAIFAAFAMMAYKNSPHAGMVLLLHPLFGLVTAFRHQFMKN